MKLGLPTAPSSSVMRLWSKPIVLSASAKSRKLIEPASPASSPLKKRPKPLLSLIEIPLSSSQRIGVQGLC